MFAKTQEDREKYLIFITDGKPSFHQSPCNLAQDYADADINIFAIGIGPEAEKNKEHLECLKVADGTNEVEVILVNEFTDLKEAFVQVTDNCENTVKSSYDGRYVWEGKQRNG